MHVLGLLQWFGLIPKTMSEKIVKGIVSISWLTFPDSSSEGDQL